MDKFVQQKPKNKKQLAAKPKTDKKKRKSDGATCSMFIAELTRKLAAKRREEVESPVNIIQTIVDSITNALPIKIIIKSNPAPPPIEQTSSVLENLSSLSPELLPNDTLSMSYPGKPTLDIDNEVFVQEIGNPLLINKSSFGMPKMPVVNSDVMKVAAEKENRRRRELMLDATTTTATDHDVASELAKHVGTLRKISLIAEEFNQKTAKNLKEIVDSVQEDLIKKLEEVRAEQRARVLSLAIQEHGHTSD